MSKKFFLSFFWPVSDCESQNILQQIFDIIQYIIA